MDAVTQDTLFAGALNVIQPQKGHRIGSDAVLLAAACPPALSSICDLGAGVGAVGLRAAQLCSEAQVLLVEKNADIAVLAGQNVALNHLARRVSVRIADVFDKSFAAQGTELAQAFECVLTNPPFETPGRTRLSPVAYRAAAHVLSGALADWLVAALRLLRPGGTLVMIHRADRLPEILAALDGRFGNVALRFIHPSGQKPASRVLLQAVKGSRAPLGIMPPLMMHEHGVGAPKFTQEAEAIHQGTASAWQM